MEQKERMDQGLIYDPADNRISTEQTSCLDAQYEFNATRPSEMKKRAVLLKQMLGAIGENCYIEPPFRANWGGKHVYMGNNVYANFNLTVVDDGNIYIGDNVMFGPNVTIATANHPILPELREKGLQYNKDVHIGKKCLDRSRRRDCSRYYNREQFRHWCRQCGCEGYSCKCCRCRKPVPCSAGNQPA